MNKPKILPEHFSTLSIRHIVNGKPVEIDGAKEAAGICNEIFEEWYRENILKYTDEIAVLKDKIMRDMLIMGEAKVFLTEGGVEIK